MGNSLSPQIANAEKTGVCSLNGKNLKELPPEFSKLSKVLRTTDLSKNKLHEFPPVLGQFSNLKSLTIENNLIGTIPEFLGNLTKLETISLGYNHIHEIPKAVFPKLKNLTTLSLKNNRLKMFPIEICQLKKLDAVDLSGNLIERIPDNLEHLHAVELNMNQNRLQELPGSLCKCERLKVFRAEENCLGLDAISTDLLRNSQISVLALDGNLFPMRSLRDKDGYESYMERYTATKKKFV